MWVVFLHQRHTKLLHFCVTSIFRHFKSHLYLADSNSNGARFLMASRSKGPVSVYGGGPGRTSDPRLTDGQRRRQEIDKLSFCLKCDELHCSRSVTPLRWDQTRVTDVMDEKHQRRRSSVESERESLQLQPGAKTNFFFSSNIFTETEQNAGFKHRSENNLKASGLA